MNNDSNGGLAIRCPRCQNGDPKDNPLAVHRGPEILFMNISKPGTGFHNQTASTTKIVMVPDTLDLSRHTDRGQALRYQLCGIVSYSGNGHAGHYIALCRQADGTFMCFNDSAVYAETLDAFLDRQRHNMNPYIIAYRRIEPERPDDDESEEDEYEGNEPPTSNGSPGESQNTPHPRPAGNPSANSQQGADDNEDGQAIPRAHQGLMHIVNMTADNVVIAKDGLVTALPPTKHAELPEGTTYSRRVIITGEFRVGNNMYKGEMEGIIYSEPVPLSANPYQAPQVRSSRTPAHEQEGGIVTPRNTTPAEVPAGGLISSSIQSVKKFLSDSLFGSNGGSRGTPLSSLGKRSRFGEESPSKDRGTKKVKIEGEAYM